jgi:hypothetical protein
VNSAAWLSMPGSGSEFESRNKHVCVFSAHAQRFFLVSLFSFLFV